MSYTQSYYHIVFRTRNSEKTIPEEAEKQLYMYIFTFSRNKGCKVFRIGGMPDHIHILVGLVSNLSVAQYVKELKETTSKWLRLNPQFPDFRGWAEGYAGLSCGYKALKGITDYIMGQKEHHRHISFKDEYMSWLESEGIPVDSTYFLKGDT